MTLYPPATIQAGFRQIVESWGMERSSIDEAAHSHTREVASLVWCEKSKRWAVHLWEWSRGAELVAFFIGPDSTRPH